MISVNLFKLPNREQATRRLALAGNVILALLLGHQAGMLMGFFDEKQAVTLPARALNLQPIAAPKPEKNTAVPLEELRLFGDPPTSKRQETETQAPEIRPALKLRGVIHSANSRAARAIITEANGRDVAYPVGARLPGGMRLTKINPRDVVVSYRGREEHLRLSNKMTPES